MVFCDYWLYSYTCIQIIFESLPVSSSGHVALASRLFGCFLPEKFIHAYDYALHGVTLFVLAWYFLPRICTFLFNNYQEITIRRSLPTFMLLFFATCWTVLLWVFVNSYMPARNWFMPYGFTVTAMLLVSLYFLQRTQSSFRTDSYGKIFLMASVLGIVQGVSLLPGISRLASTYVAARWLRFSPEQAFYCSIALQVPLCAAGFLKGMYGLVTLDSVSVSSNYYVLAACIVLSCVVSYGALYLTEWLMRKRLLWLLGFYELFLALTLFFVV